MGVVQRPRGGGLVDLARLDADEAVLDHVGAANAVLAGPLVEGLHERHAIHLVAVEAHRAAVLEADDDLARRIGRGLRRARPLVDVFGRRDPGSSRTPASMLRPQRFSSVLYGLAFVAGDGDVALGGPLDLFFAGHAVLAHGGDDLEVGRERARADVEPHLVVALAGAAVGDGGRALLARDVDEHLGDERAAEGGGEEVLALVDGARHQRGEDEEVDERALAVADDRLDGADLHARFSTVRRSFSFPRSMVSATTS